MQKLVCLRMELTETSALCARYTRAANANLDSHKVSRNAKETNQLTRKMNEQTENAEVTVETVNFSETWAHQTKRGRGHRQLIPSPEGISRQPPSNRRQKYNIKALATKKNSTFTLSVGDILLIFCKLVTFDYRLFSKGPQAY